LRWHEQGSPGGKALTLFFCSKYIAGFGVVEGLDNLESSYWERYSRCRHYKVIENESDALAAARAVEKLFKLTMLNKHVAIIT